MSRLTRGRTGRLNPSRETEFSGTCGDRGILIFPVQLTTSRIGSLTRLIHALLYVMTIHTYILYCTAGVQDVVKFFQMRATTITNSITLLYYNTLEPIIVPVGWQQHNYTSNGGASDGENPTIDPTAPANYDDCLVPRLYPRPEAELFRISTCQGEDALRTGEWVLSEDPKYQGQDSRVRVERCNLEGGIFQDDYGLLLDESHKHYAVGATLPKPFDNTGKVPRCSTDH